MSIEQNFIDQGKNDSWKISNLKKKTESLVIQPTPINHY